VKVEGGARIPAHKVFSWQQEALKHWNSSDKSGIAVPLDIAYKLCKEKFGDKFRWPTETFELEQHGPTWFVEGSESESSAIIKEHGIYSFSSHASDKPFRAWDDPSLLGNLVGEYREKNISDAVKGIYFDGRGYYHKNRITGHWDVDALPALQRELKVNHRLSPLVPKGRIFSDLDEAVNFIEANQRVAYGTNMLCVPPGVFIKDGKSVFNYAQPVIIQPSESSVTQWGVGFPFLAKFLDTVFDDPPDVANIQRDRFLMAAKRLYESFSNFTPRRQSAMFLVGPKNIGKTFISTGILGTMLGGSNDPTSTLIEGNRFNADMLGTPVWSLDDPQGSGVQASQFSDMLKRFVANPEVRSEQKFVQGGMGAFNGIVCVTMNDNAASMELLPEVDRSNSDKWHFFKLKQSDVTFGESECANIARLQQELPAFIKWLIEWKIPAALEQRFPVNARWGNATYMHPTLLESSQHGSLKMTYKEALIVAIVDKAGETEFAKELTMSVPALLKAMNQAMHGTGLRYSPKLIDRYMSEFMEDGWPVKRTQTERGTVMWNIQLEYFKPASNDNAN